MRYITSSSAHKQIVAVTDKGTARHAVRYYKIDIPCIERKTPSGIPEKGIGSAMH